MSKTSQVPFVGSKLEEARIGLYDSFHCLHKTRGLCDGTTKLLAQIISTGACSETQDVFSHCTNLC